MTPQPPQSNRSPEQAIRDTLQKLADALVDATGLEVTTRIKIYDPNNPTAAAQGPVQVASTKIQFDGDRELEVPVFYDTGEMTIIQSVYELHERNVKESLEYRRSVLQLLSEFVKARRIG